MSGAVIAGIHDSTYSVAVLASPGTTDGCHAYTRRHSCNRTMTTKNRTHGDCRVIVSGRCGGRASGNGLTLVGSVTTRSLGPDVHPATERPAPRTAAARPTPATAPHRWARTSSALRARRRDRR